jgi:hypothetical protein
MDGVSPRAREIADANEPHFSAEKKNARPEGDWHEARTR